MIETGTVLQNRYRIERQIGQGGMGAVYIATDERFGSTVAIKETFFSDENYGKAFEREARLLNNLRHSALPRVSDHFIEENGQFLVMEYIEGDDLSEKMQETKAAFPIADVLDWADQLLDALDYLHTQEKPVIHRDIKPQNLKLTPRGQVILLDFGLAKGSPTDVTHKTAAQSVFGYSKNYASLEQMQGTGTDPRSDLYSLGATLYHLMTGVAPIDALTRAMTVLNGDQDPLKPAHLIHEQVPVGVADILMRAMALNANHRPSSAIAMRSMLAENTDFAAGEYIAGMSKSSSTGLLTQKTELIDSTAEKRETENPTILTTATPEEIIGTQSVKKLRATTNADVGYGTPDTSAETVKTQSKKGLFVGAALGGVLMTGSALGIYFVKPDIFGETNQTVELPATNSSQSNLVVENPANNPAALNTNIAANAESFSSAQKESADKSANRATAQQSSTVAKNSAKSAKTAQTQQSSATVKEKEMGEDDVKITGERIETKEVVVDNGRVIFKNPNNRPRVQDGRPPLTIEQIRKLPPAQRRRVRRILERNLPPDVPKPPDNQ